MITIFTIPKPFTDPHISMIQKNAIKSWTLISPDIEIFLVGNDAGVSDVVKEFNIRHVPEVKINEHNTPLLDSAFSLVRQKASNNILMYVNCDIILTKDVLDLLNMLPQNNFLAVGRRHDLDIKEKIDFTEKDWNKKLISEAKENGKLHSPAGIDYFVFEKEGFKNIPPFSVGRIGWDNWMIHEARKKKMSVIDATGVIFAIHQNHGYSGVNAGAQRKSNDEAKKNLSFSQNKADLFTIEDANMIATQDGIKKKHLFWMPYIKRIIRNIING